MRNLATMFSAIAFFGLSGCEMDVPETVEECKERFAKLGAGAMFQRNGDWIPIYTYDISKSEDFFGKSVADGAKGMHVTMVQGHSENALNAFYDEEVPAQGAIFSSDSISLFRIGGEAAPREETVSYGCETAPDKSRLIHIAWTAKPNEVNK